MIRQTMRSLALAAVGLALAGGAWGQVLRQAASPELDVALEYFGASAGREIQASKFGDPDGDGATRVRPYVSLTVATAAITAGNVADITFTVSGATFSETVAPANLDRRDAGCDSTAKGALQVALQSGGAQGDSSATFRVTSPSPDGLAVGNVICFWVPNLMATLTTVTPATDTAPAVMGVNVVTSITQGVTNNNPFPTVINGPDFNHDMDDGTTPEIPGPIDDKTIFRAMPALMTSLGMGETALVNIEDRTKIMAGSGTADPSAMDPATAARGLTVGTLNIGVTATAGDILKLDGSGAVATASTDGGAIDTIDASLGGQVKLSVGGPFQAGDKVVFGSGSMARSVAPSGGMADTAVELKFTTDMGIVYVPGGTGTLTPSTFAAAGMYSFNSLDNNSNLPIMTSTGRIDYDGIAVQAYAYGVVRGGGSDTSYVRVTCNAPTGMCQVFADCTDQAGESYFGGPVPIAAGATGVVNSDAIALALGGGWDSGRGACDIYSTHDLSVQHMVRSGDTLVNNSAVVGRDLDEDTSAIDAIKAVVDNICASVGQGDPATVDDAEVDTVCQPVDTTPVP